jgi:hypothetical protein
MPFGCTCRQRLFRQQALKHVDLPALKKYQVRKAEDQTGPGPAIK